MTDAAGHHAPQAAYAAPIAQPSQGLSIASLVLGIASLAFSWTFFAPIVGLVLGILAVGREPAGKTMAVWGIVLNAVMLAGAVIAAMLAVVGIGLSFAFLPFAFL
ncbi:DUF4190 domain-containing protein [Leifsonia poae]|uniref:DUF4190 domain-containing protein n=1 Tax=Leifsonia poae TaxID=110933 RepID=UPI001CC116EF|nr:DUF4190 domain-containing protein [Leifsonia poae]